MQVNFRIPVVDNRGRQLDFLTKYVHPADLDFLTAAELDQLVRSVGKIRGELSFVAQDLARAQIHGKRVIFLLDFSELHAFLWPETSSSQYKAASAYLLTQSNLELVLPPGAIVELFRKLKEEADKFQGGRAQLNQLLSKPFAQALFDLYSGFPDKSAQLLGTASGKQFEELLSDVRTASQAVERLSRLATLYDSGRLKLLSAYPGAEDVVPDRGVYADALSQLSSARPMKDNNVVDATNYAFTFALNKKLYKSQDLFFLLVTSSPTPYRVFERIKWHGDPMFGREPTNIVRTSLVRHPAQLLFYGHLASQPELSEKSLSRAQKDLEHIHKSWSRLEEYRKFNAGTARGSEKVALPKGDPYFARLKRFSAFYSDVLRPLNELLSMDSAQEANRRRIRQIDAAGVGGLYALDEAQTAFGKETSITPITINLRQIIGLYDRLINLSADLLARTKTALANVAKSSVAEMDPRGYLVPIEHLYTKSAFNAGLECAEVTVYLRQAHTQDLSYLSGDVYKDYASLWWTTNTDFAEFLDAVRYFIRAVGSPLTSDEGQIKPNKEKKYSGVYFFLGKEIRRFPIEELEGLSTAEIFNRSELNWRPRFVRIGLKYADLCYDFEPVSHFPQRAGIVTYLKMSDQVTDFIRWTHSKYVRKPILANRVSEVLNLIGNPSSAAETEASASTGAA